jgi:glycosyltransferase involved in cell wall biosynthesis
MNKNCRIAYFPPPSDKNSYTIRMTEILNSFGTVTPITPKKIGKLASEWKRFDVVFFNWLENKAFNKNGDISFKGLILAFVWFQIMRVISKKIVYVRHNNYPHNIKEKNISFSMKLMNYFESHSDSAIVHAEYLSNYKRVYVPHPLYSFLNSNTERKINKYGSYYVCFGRIEKYKKLDKLIASWPKGYRLVIAGASSDTEYIDFLKRLGTGKDIIILDKFISDEEAFDLVANALYSILPCDSKCMIVSGSFFFSLSAGTIVIAVDNQFYESLENKDNALYVLNDISDVQTFIPNSAGNKAVINESFLKQFSDEVITSQLKKAIED